MNAIIALCHFCEVHGPVVVFCTQPYSKNSMTSDASIAVIDKVTSEETKNYVQANNLYKLFEISNQSNINQKQVCPSCTSIGKDGLPLISNDHSARISYMSSQSPEDNALFTLLRHACIRSLTCEITPGEDGAIYFGEETNGHVISYRFKLLNSQARGLRSTFSIVILSKDKLALLNLWPFLVPNLKTIVTRLQEAAQTVYHDETQANNSINQGSIGMMSNTSGIDSTTRSTMGSTVNPEVHPAIGFRRAGDKEQRKLTSITQQDNIFQHLHSWFTWLLRTSGSTFKDWQPTTLDLGEECSRSLKDIIKNENDDLENHVGDLIKLYQLLDINQLSTLIFHAVVGNQIIVRCANEKISVAITQALSILLPKGCVRLGYDRTVYRPVFQYNLLALDINVPLSNEVTSVDADPCVVLLVTSKSDIQQTSLSLADINIRMDSSKPPIAINLSSPISMTCNPKIVKQFTDFLSRHENFTLKIMEVNLILVVNEWLQNAELYFAYKRRQHANKLPDTEYENRLNQFLRAIGVTNNADHAVLRFWAQGMTDEYRRNILFQVHKDSNKSSSNSSQSINHHTVTSQSNSSNNSSSATHLNSSVNNYHNTSDNL